MADQEVGNLAVKVSMDSTGFQNGVSGINKQLAVVQSGFKAASAELGGFGNSSDQLNLKSSSLNQQIDLQKQKVQALEQAFQTSADKKGLDAKATQDLQIKLNNAKTALATMETELGKTNELLEEGSAKQGLFGQAADKMGLNLGSLKTAFGTVGLAAGAYLVSAVGSAEKAQSSIEGLTNLLKNQGMSAKDAGESIDSFTSAITKMSDFSEEDARDALQVLTEKGVSASKALGMESTLVNVAAGENVSLSDAASLVADAYNGKTVALTKLGILTKAEAKQLTSTKDATMSMADVQQRLNDRFGGSAQAQLGTYSGQMKQMQNQMDEAKEAIGTALLPVLAELAQGIAKIVLPIADFIKQNPQFTAAVLSITAVLGTLVGGASAFNTLKMAFGPLIPILDGVGLSLEGLIAPVLAVIAAIALVAFAGYEIYQNWDTIKVKAQELWASIKQTFSDVGSFFSSTWNSATSTMKNAWNGIVSFFTNLWNGIKTFFLNISNGIVSGIMAIITPFASGFLSLWESMNDGISTIIEGLKTFFLENGQQ